MTRFWAGIAAGFAGFGGVAPILVFGPGRALELTRAWIGLLARQPHDLYMSDINQGLLSTAARWIAIGGIAGWVISGACVATCAYAFYRLVSVALRRSVFDEPLKAVSPWLILMQLVNPLAWRWGSMLLVGAPFAAEERVESRVPAALAAVLAIALLWLVQLNPVAAALGFGHWTELHHYGSITLEWLLLLTLCV